MEYRAPDACCNPYLTHAVLLAAIADGIRRRIEPGLPEPTDAGRVPEALRDVRFPSLPRTLGEAIEAFEADEVVSASLPTELRETFLAIKRDEWERSCGAVTDWQRAMYLGYLP
jgi:glutamine synthetase